MILHSLWKTWNIFQAKSMDGIKRVYISYGILRFSQNAILLFYVWRLKKKKSTLGNKLFRLFFANFCNVHIFDSSFTHCRNSWPLSLVDYGTVPNVTLLKMQHQSANWKYTPGYTINKGDPGYVILLILPLKPLSDCHYQISQQWKDMCFIVSMSDIHY